MTRFQVMPDLTPAEYADLRQDIEQHGVLVPVLVSESGEIVDGHNRARIADKLRVPYPTKVLEGYSDESLRDAAYRLNLHRRHLTREQRREIIEASLRSDPQLSDRQHAERTGASPTTVGSRRADLEAIGELSKLDSRTSADGRERPSSQPIAKVTETTKTETYVDTDTGEVVDPSPGLTAMRDAECNGRIVKLTGPNSVASPSSPQQIAAQAMREARNEPWAVLTTKINADLLSLRRWIEERGIPALVDNRDSIAIPGVPEMGEGVIANLLALGALGDDLQREVERRSIGLRRIK